MASVNIPSKDTRILEKKTSLYPNVCNREAKYWCTKSMLEEKHLKYRNQLGRKTCVRQWTRFMLAGLYDKMDNTRTNIIILGAHLNCFGLFFFSLAWKNVPFAFNFDLCCASKISRHCNINVCNIHIIEQLEGGTFSTQCTVCSQFVWLSTTY